MSRTKHVHYRGRAFWAYDASLAVWLVRFVQYMERHDDEHLNLGPVVFEARQVAAIPDMGLDLDRILAADASAELVSIVAEVTEQIREAGPIPSDDIASVILFEDVWPVSLRVQPGAILDPEPIASIGDALGGLLTGTLPSPPEGTWWYVGVPGFGWLTIKMAGSPTTG